MPDRIEIERTGGLAGLGSPMSRLVSRGSVDFEALEPREQRQVEALFMGAPPKANRLERDAFTYRITRQTATGEQTIEADEEDVPRALLDSIRDELR